MTLLAVSHTLFKVSKPLDTEGGEQCYRERSEMPTVLDIRRPHRGVLGVCASSARRPKHVDKFRQRARGAANAATLRPSRRHTETPLQQWFVRSLGLLAELSAALFAAGGISISDAYNAISGTQCFPTRKGRR